MENYVIITDSTNNESGWDYRAFQNEVNKFLKENPGLMLKNVPAMVGMSESYVNALVKELKAQGVLCYVRKGNTHTGRWVVNDKK